MDTHILLENIKSLKEKYKDLSNLAVLHINNYSFFSRYYDAKQKIFKEI